MSEKRNIDKGRVLMKIFTIKYSAWNILYKKKNQEWCRLKGTKRYWYADPFLKEWNGKKYLFMEAYDLVWSIGRIAVSEWNGKNFSKPRVIIKNPYHMSYPFVFEYRNELYMLPETGQNRTLELYKADNQSPYAWKKIKILSNDIMYADATIVLKNDIYYIIAYEEGNNEWKTHVFILDMDQLKINRIETVVMNENTGRSAGRTFKLNEDILRPVQLNTKRYGGGIIIEKINNLAPFSTSKIKTIEIDDLNINNIEGDILGVHTLALDDELYIVDILVSGMNVFAPWIITVRKIRNLIYRLLYL